MIKGTGQRLIPRKLLEWIKGLHKGEGAGLNISTLTDSDGNSRFIEGDGVPIEKEGVEITYCKWSLSGSHLMLVCAGTVENGVTIANNSIIASYTLPDYIKNKIYPVWDNNIEVKQVPMYASDWSTQNLYCKFQKITAGLQIQTGALTLTAERSFRAQFDLLIDSE